MGYTEPPPMSLSVKPILLVNFIGTLGFSIVLPFLIVLVLNFGGNELIYGILGATYSFFQLIGAPVLGSWSDRIGRRKVLLISQAGTFLAWVIFMISLLIPETQLATVKSAWLGAFVLTLPLLLLFLARALDGITGGNVSVANAYLVDVTEEKDRQKYFGQMSMAGNLGFIIGPALAGLLGSTTIGNILPILTAMFISLTAIFVIKYRLKDSSGCTQLDQPVSTVKTRKVLGQELKECHSMEGENKYTLWEIFALKNVAFTLVLYFLIFLAFNFFYVSFPVHAVSSLKWTVLQLGLFFSALSGVMIIFQGPVLRRLSTKYSDATLFAIGCVLLMVGFYAFTSTREVFLLIGVGLFAAGNGIGWPSFMSILSKTGNKSQQGAIQGFASSAGSLASIIGLVLGGILYTQLHSMVFIVPAAVMLVVIFSLSLKALSRA